MKELRNFRDLLDMSQAYSSYTMSYESDSYQFSREIVNVPSEIENLFLRFCEKVEKTIPPYVDNILIYVEDSTFAIEVNYFDGCGHSPIPHEFDEEISLFPQLIDLNWSIFFQNGQRNNLKRMANHGQN